MDVGNLISGSSTFFKSSLFTGRTDVEAETSILWPPDANSWLIWKDPDAGKDWGQEEKGMTEDEMVGWYHWLNGHGFGWTPGVGDGQGAWRAVVHGVSKNWTRLSNWTELRLLCPWNFPDKNTEVGCHFLLQGIFLTQGSNPPLLHLLHRQADSLSLCRLGSAPL